MPPSQALDAARPLLRLVPRDAHMARMEALAATIDDAMGPFESEGITRERPCPQMRARGVYAADMWDSDGNPILYAIDSRGRLRHWVSWHPTASLEAIQRDLWQTLNQMDPIGR